MYSHGSSRVVTEELSLCPRVPLHDQVCARLKAAGQRLDRMIFRDKYILNELCGIWRKGRIKAKEVVHRNS